MKKYGFLSILVLSLVCTGCASAPRTIPAGEWSGTGTFADYEMAENPQEGNSGLRAIENTYPTTLSICEKQIYGHHALCFDIHSNHGTMLNMEDEVSHITFALVKARSLADGSELYAMADFGFNRSGSEIKEEDFKNGLKRVTASCIRQDRALVLQISYVLGDRTCVWDTFLFEGNILRKIGRCIQFKTDEQKFYSIDWAEELRRNK